MYKMLSIFIAVFLASIGALTAALSYWAVVNLLHEAYKIRIRHKNLKRGVVYSQGGVRIQDGEPWAR